jgi:predicted Zn-dependent protease
VALAVVCGLALMAFSYFVLGSGSSGETIGDFTDFTVTNRTDGEVTVLLDRITYGRVGGEERTFSTYKWDGRRLVQVVDERGRIIYSERLSKGDLKRMDYRIVTVSITLEVVPEGGLANVPPCTGSEREGCLEAQSELAPIAQTSCEGSGRRVCFVPLGQVDPELVLSLVQYYGDEYGLDIGVLTPSAIPAGMTNPDREQIDGESLSKYLGRLFPADFANPNVALIGLTPLDLYAEDRNWYFQLGNATWAPQAHAVVSTYRMHLGTLYLVDDERVLSRTRKMVTKYLGLMFYDLPLNDDPTSPMYGNILSVSDLDRMEEVYPVPVRP